MHLCPVVTMGDRSIGPHGPTFVIAEIGSNHDGRLEEAIRHVHAAKEAGADAVKFQSFSAEGLVSRKRPIGNDPARGWEPHPAYAVLDRLELADDWHAPLKRECDRIGIEFLAAPFELAKARLLRDTGVSAIKIASGELTHLALLREVGSYGVPLFVSTGAATLGEVQVALDTILSAGCTRVVLLHCVSHYPPRFDEMNVRAVATLAQTFGCPVGISDHTPGHTVPLLSLALGGRCVEKHVTFDRGRQGPDHPYALEWPEFAAMVHEIRRGEQALGTGHKVPGERETPERIFARRGLYAARDLAAGERLTTENTKLVRHAFGVSASEAERVYGMTLARRRLADEAIGWQDLKP